MAKPDILRVDGHAYSWRRLRELRRQQIEAWAKAEARQLALFELKTDCRPRAERSADGRYRQSSLLDALRGDEHRPYVRLAISAWRAGNAGEVRPVASPAPPN